MRDSRSKKAPKVTVVVFDLSELGGHSRLVAGRGFEASLKVAPTRRQNRFRD